jgi:hypothetical protein
MFSVGGGLCGTQPNWMNRNNGRYVDVVATETGTCGVSAAQILVVLTTFAVDLHQLLDALQLLLSTLKRR